MSRWPLRLRLIGGFIAVMLLVLSAAGTFVYQRVQYALDQQLDTLLVDAKASLMPLLEPSGRLPNGRRLPAGESFQVFAADGRLLDAEPAGSAPLLDAAMVKQALDQPVRRDFGNLLPSGRVPLRIYATALPRTSGEATVLAVAADRSARDEALRELLGELFTAGLATLLITAFVGDRLAKAALRPVERYRRQAADITAGASGVRLDVPAGRDDEITRLGHTLNDMLVALEEALEHEQRFVNDASHELRTPLTLIGTRVQLAQRRRRTADQHEAVLAEIKTDIDRLTHLADQLLRLGGQQQDDNSHGPTDLAAVARAVLEQRRTLAAEGSPFEQTGALSVHAAGPVDVDLPSHQLERLVRNLLDNAAVHGRPPVTVVADEHEGTARLVVTDAGDGADSATLATAPQRFARAPEARNRPGSGLGLALVHAVGLAAGGELRLCSRGRHERFGPALGRPCTHGPEMTVSVLLPVARTPPRDSAPNENHRPPGESPAPQ